MYGLEDGGGLSKICGASEPQPANESAPAIQGQRRFRIPHGSWRNSGSGLPGSGSKYLSWVGATARPPYCADAVSPSPGENTADWIANPEETRECIHS